MRALVEPALVAGNGYSARAQRSQTDGRPSTDAAINVKVLKRMPDLESPELYSVSYETDKARYYFVQRADPRNKVTHAAFSSGAHQHQSEYSTSGNAHLLRGADRRFEKFDLAGEAKRSMSSFVGGSRNLPSGSG